jgi:hypothetical protein
VKKLLTLLLTLAVLSTIVGCGEEAAITAPANFVISAAADEISVVLDWDPNPTDEEVDGYIVYFNDVVLDTTDLETYTHTDPQETGEYYVTAYAGDEESDPSETESTVPVVATNVILAELNAAGESGYGWNTTTGQGAVYSMIDDTHAAVIDLYFTNWATGFSGAYDLRSPDLAPDDPGAPAGIVGTSGWKLTGFIAVADDFDDVTTLPLTGYIDRVLNVAQGFTYGVYTEEEHYAMVEVQSINAGTGQVQVRTAFQVVPGLAILEH